MRSLLVLLTLFTFLLPVLAADPVSDDVIFDKVRIQLANDREVGGGRIEVKVSQGVVELIGKVKTEKQKARAEKLTKKVKGVRQVVNRLQVTPV